MFLQFICLAYLILEFVWVDGMVSVNAFASVGQPGVVVVVLVRSLLKRLYVVSSLIHGFLLWSLGIFGLGRVGCQPLIS